MLYQFALSKIQYEHTDTFPPEAGDTVTVVVTCSVVGPSLTGDTLGLLPVHIESFNKESGI